MKKIMIFVLVLFVCHKTAFSTSFNCTQAVTAVEKMICSKESLSSLDDFLAQAYKDVLTVIEHKKQLQTEQKTWLKEVRNTCQDITCLENAYGNRIATLKNTVAQNTDPSPAPDDSCTTSEDKVSNKDGSSFVSTKTECTEPYSQKTIITLLSKEGQKPKEVLRLSVSEEFSSIPSSSYFVDLEQDGIYEFEEDQPNGVVHSDINIYKLHKNRQSMFHYYSGNAIGVSSYENGFLLESTRNGCCEHSYLIYPAKAHKYPIGNADENASSAEYGVGVTTDYTTEELRCIVSKSTPAKFIKQLCPDDTAYKLIRE